MQVTWEVWILTKGLTYILMRQESYSKYCTKQPAKGGYKYVLAHRICPTGWKFESQSGQIHKFVHDCIAREGVGHNIKIIARHITNGTY